LGENSWKNRSQSTKLCLDSKLQNAWPAHAAYTLLEGVNFIMIIDITELEYKSQHTLLKLIFIDLY